MYSVNIALGWVLVVFGLMNMSRDGYMAILMFIMAKLCFIHADMYRNN